MAKSSKQELLFETPKTAQPAAALAPRKPVSTSKPKASKPKTEVVRHEPAAAPAVTATTPDPFLAMIREVAMNKDLDVGKLDALLAMQERILERNNMRAWDDALAQMQPELPVIDRKGRIIVRAKDAKGERTGVIQQSTPYAKWEDVVEEISPIIGRHGFGLRFRTSITEKGLVRVEGILSGHGHREVSDIELMHDSTGSKNSVQAIASSISYGKRIVGSALLNIVTRGEDVDGSTSGAPMVVGATLTAEQIEQIIDLAAAVECPRKALLDHLNKVRPNGHPEADGLEHLPAARFDEVISALRSWEASRKEREKEKAK